MWFNCLWSILTMWPLYGFFESHLLARSTFICIMHTLSLHVFNGQIYYLKRLTEASSWLAILLWSCIENPDFLTIYMTHWALLYHSLHQLSQTLTNNSMSSAAHKLDGFSDFFLEEESIAQVSLTKEETIQLIGIKWRWIWQLLITPCNVLHSPKKLTCWHKCYNNNSVNHKMTHSLTLQYRH